MRHRDFQLPGCQDTKLYAQAWLPEREPQAVLVLAHGLAEHGGRYQDFATRFVGRGYAVYAIDHRGHGRPDPGRLPSRPCNTLRSRVNTGFAVR